jgi:hypothetical protein
LDPPNPIPNGSTLRWDIEDYQIGLEKLANGTGSSIWPSDDRET